MADQISIEFDDAELQRVFGRLTKRVADLSPLMADVGELLLESTKQRFVDGKAPDGTPWLPLKDGSGRAPLVLTGTMRDQIFAASGADFAEISATAKQARWHQFGVDPFQVEALNFGFVDHPGIPARPFMGVSADDERAIIDLALAYLDPEG